MFLYLYIYIHLYTYTYAFVNLFFHITHPCYFLYKMEGVDLGTVLKLCIHIYIYVYIYIYTYLYTHMSCLVIVNQGIIPGLGPPILGWQESSGIESGTPEWQL